MIDFGIYCDEYDFNRLAKALENEVEADCPLVAEIVFADENYIRELNAKFRGIDRATDVLSFPTLDGVCERAIRSADFPYDIDEDGKLSIGTVVICTQVAKAQAEEYGHSYDRELYYLAVHGLCHLLGYDHIEEDDRAKMRTKEERILGKIGLTRD